jgi:hypothetical protein
MEDNIFMLITQTFNEGMRIPLITVGRFYTYLGVSNTVINNELYFDAIHYRINQNNSKRITRLFIELTYQYYIQNNDYPSRNWYIQHEHLSYEYASRKCNYSIVQGLINIVLHNN